MTGNEPGAGDNDFAAGGATSGVNRRSLLASLGAAASGLAGCAGILGEDDTDTLTPVSVPGDETAGTGPTGRGRTPTATPNRCADSDSVYRLDHPPLADLPPPDARFADVECPTFGQSAVVCHTAAAVESADVLLVGLETVATVGEQSGDILGFLLANRSGRRYRHRPGAWTILARDGGDGWRPVRSGTPGCTRTLRDGAVHYWELGVGTVASGRPVNVTAIETSLPGGVYALAVTVLRSDGTDTVCVAPFEVLRVSEPDRTVRERTPDDSEYIEDPGATATPMPTAEEL
jgi:hypothetical protein